MKLWVILPAYNEERALPLVLDSLVKNLQKRVFEYEIVVVDDGSADNTGKIAFDHPGAVTLICNKANRGLGDTVRRGFVEVVAQAGREDVIITMDADNTHPVEVIDLMLDKIATGSDVVIASRYRYKSRVCGVPFKRIVLSKIASWSFRLIFAMPGVRDYTCGYRAYRSRVIAKMIEQRGKGFIAETGFACMVEILLNLYRQKTIISEVPLELRYDLKPSASKIRIVETIQDTLRLLLKRRLSGKR